MKHCMIIVVATLATSIDALALPCPGVPIPFVCTYLQPNNDPGGTSVTMGIGETAVVQLVLDIPEGTTMLTFDAIINQFQGDAYTPSTAFQVVDLIGYDPPGTMDFTGWGDVDSNLPAFLHNDDLQYLADTRGFPLDGDDGTPGPVTVVMGDLVVEGISANVQDGGMLRFHSPGGLGTDFSMPVIHPGSPGGFQLLFDEVEQRWRFADVVVFHSVGGNPFFENFFHEPYIAFEVNVTPEPASSVLLAIGFAAIWRRRRCQFGHDVASVAVRPSALLVIFDTTYP